MKKVLPAQHIGPDSCRPPVMQDTRGAVAVFVAIMIVVLLAFGAVALDISNAMIARNELQNVADASALAGTRQLGLIYKGLSSGTPYNTYVLSNPSAVVSAATTVALANRARQVPIVINASDIQIGVWNATARTFTVGNVGATGVRVTARRDGGANGPITTWVAGIIGINSMNVVATATAALTGTGSTAPRELETPFGISSFRFTTPYCNQPVRFYPANDPIACAGWHTWFATPNAKRLRDNINALIPNPPGSPETDMGDRLEFTGGNVATALNNLYNLYNTKRYTDNDGNNNIWTALVPVYQGTDCSNPNTALPIVGYATMQISNVAAPPNTQVIQGVIACNIVDGGRGGGGSFGTLGSIPGLVE